MDPPFLAVRGCEGELAELHSVKRFSHPSLSVGMLVIPEGKAVGSRCPENKGPFPIWAQCDAKGQGG